ncbi:MAG TPA: arsenic resistance N-acetyltransferase ArsN2 [Gemmatimonadaceae bacterium]|jgi:amino-acid N-acetyltransferase|nr:arsenic resistance N-acetyltransferase ArsN2 [Gemmatimonadaceae bacterium]
MTATNTPTIRSARPSDLAGITALLKASDLPIVGVAESLDGFLVSETDGDIVGVVGLEACCSEYALLRSTAVAPAWRGRGLGRQLVERAIASAESRGFHALYLLTTTAERYFPSFGFSTVARDVVPDEVRATDEFRAACPASATVMSKPLAAT